MILPLFPAGAFGEPASFVVAVGIGVAFGAVLERAGLGSATKLAGQFYFTDFVVFKVMFTAIVTAMLGVYALSWIGVMDLHQLTVPPTWLLPQLVGGLLFGVGFVMGGLCPGTSCVAAASGRMDGLALIAGMLAGTLLFGETFPWIARFYEATPMGLYTLPELLHLPAPATVALVAGAALAAFRLLKLWETKHALT
jgi:hypothetical protein